MKTKWHYAVKYGTQLVYMACRGLKEPWPTGYGATKIRGKVDCPDCLRAMGVV